MHLEEREFKKKTNKLLFSVAILNARVNSTEAELSVAIDVTLLGEILGLGDLTNCDIDATFELRPLLLKWSETID